MRSDPVAIAGDFDAPVAAATVELLAPELARGSYARSFRMFTWGGQDSVVATIDGKGWLAFERPMPDVFAACAAAASGAVLDVGCNTGFYSLLAAAARPDLEVHSFEPHLPIANLFAANLTINAVRSQVVLRHQAVAATEGVARLYVPLVANPSIETSASLLSDFRPHHSDTTMVETVTIDGYCARLRLPPIALIKIDVESAEYDVLCDARDVILRDRPLIFCEVLASGNLVGLEELRRRYELIDIRLRQVSAIVGAAISFDEAAWNHLLVPVERLNAVGTVLRELALSTSWVCSDDSVSL